MMNLRLAFRLIPIALLGGMLAACAPPTRPPSSAESTAQQAQTLSAEGKPAASAELFLQAARQVQPPARQRLQLRAAQQLIDAQQFDRAQSLLDSVDPQGMTTEDLARKALILAHLDMALRQPEEALTALPATTSDLPSALASDILQTKALAAQAAGNPLTAVQARLDRQPLVSNQAAIDNLHALWALLAGTTPTQLQNLQQTAQRQDVKAWLALALLAKTTPPQTSALTNALASWAQQYPDQQATAAPILTELKAQWQAFQTYPNQIAVLLPLSGPFSPVARTILDGIMNAFYQHNDPSHPIALRVYNTGAQPANLLSIYTQAVSNGAEFVIGPLNRNQVNRLATSGVVSVPTLALNYVDHGTSVPDNLYEFGLSPSNEAAQAAEKASLDGHAKAVVLVPNNDWGTRVANAFKQRFQQLGGRVLAVGQYNGRSSDFSSAIVSAFNIDQSDARRRAVSRTIDRDVEFEARRRQDVDMIFIAGDPRQARLLMPQIKFNYGGGLPVYSISDAFSGTRDALADGDLDGLVFCDAPLLLNAAGPAATARRQMHQNFPDASRRYPRLFGLGVDSFNVIPYLKRLAGQDWARLNGLSGALHMVAGHQLQRELEWAQFEQGAPVLQGNAPLPANKNGDTTQNNGSAS